MICSAPEAGRDTPVYAVRNVQTVRNNPAAIVDDAGSDGKNEIGKRLKRANIRFGGNVVCVEQNIARPSEKFS